jgi:aryl-alcohol dehydrogenase-like predicted oxidoreductase
LSSERAVIGTWPLSGDLGPVDPNTVVQTLEACVDHGLVDFDVAPSYGRGGMEEQLGRAFGHDDRVRIHTKCGNDPARGKSFEIESLRASLEDSLRRLRRPRVDTLFLHNPRGEVRDWDALLRFLEDAKQSGKIGNAGLSAAKGFAYPDEVIAAVDVLQDDVNLLYLAALQRRARPRRLFYARSPLATGILSGRLSERTRFPEGDYRASWLVGERLRSLCKRIDAIRRATDLPLPSVARRFVLGLPGVDRVIFGVKSPRHVAELATDLGAPQLPLPLVAQLEALHACDYGLSGESHLGY